MSRFLPSVLPLLLPLTLFVGVVLGFVLRPATDHWFHPEEEDPHAPAIECPDEEEEHEDHLALSEQAYKNLGLVIQPLELSDYTPALRMPGEIVEAPGYSSRRVSSPVGGRVSQLECVPGAAVTEGEVLAAIEIIDEQLLTAQLRLLKLLTQSEIINAELDRLTPLAAAGGVVGSKRLDQEYRLKEATAAIARTKQELAMRGLSPAQIAEVSKSRQAIRELKVTVPRQPPAPYSNQRGALQQDAGISIEDLYVEVGQSVGRGDPICSIAAHRTLMVRGHAFEKEIELVSRLAKQKRPVSLETGAQQNSELTTGLPIQQVAAHVQPDSQVFHFFVPLPNEVLGASRDAGGRLFRTWKFKVGQRVHVLAPAVPIPQKIVLPQDAVLQEGPDALVFREHVETFPHNLPIEGVFVEVEPVPVTVLAQDTHLVVIEPGEELKEGDRVARNSAYQLNLALKSQQEGGGGHEHHHH